MITIACSQADRSFFSVKILVAKERSARVG